MHLDKVDLPSVMHRMGHKPASMSLGGYARSDLAADQAHAETMARYVFSEMSHVVARPKLCIKLGHLG
jgi:hypothetical protein